MKEEFYVSVIIYGGIIFAGLLVTTVLLMFALKIRNKKKQAKELYNEKERSNGQHKGGSIGRW